MAKTFPKRNLTTGDIAKLCGVNFRTVIRWIQRGHLKAFQLPGRGDNRVQVSDFLQFLRDNNMPVPEELRPNTRHVLIVEDDEKAAKAMERALKRAGFEASVASDGFAAGTMASSLQPAVMTINPKMAGLGGNDVIRSIRQNPELAQMRMLVISDLTEEEFARLREDGADDALLKPFKNPDLVAKINELAGPPPYTLVKGL